MSLPVKYDKPRNHALSMTEMVLCTTCRFSGRPSGLDGGSKDGTDGSQQLDAAHKHFSTHAIIPTACGVSLPSNATFLALFLLAENSVHHKASQMVAQSNAEEIRN